MTASDPPQPVPSRPLADITGDDVVQLVVHGAMIPWLSQYLTDRGLRITPWPHEADELDTYMVTPGPGLMGLTGT